MSTLFNTLILLIRYNLLKLRTIHLNQNCSYKIMKQCYKSMYFGMCNKTIEINIIFFYFYYIYKTISKLTFHHFIFMLEERERVYGNAYILIKRKETEILPSSAVIENML